MRMQIFWAMLVVTFSLTQASGQAPGVHDDITRATTIHRDDDLGVDQGQIVEKFDWAQVDKQDVPGGVNVAWNWWPSMGEPAVFAGTYGNEPIDLNLRTLGPDICSKLSAARYAIVSRLGYEHILEGGYLEMLIAYAPAKGGQEIRFSSGTTADSGPAAQIEGTEASRLLVLPFDATRFRGKLLRIELNLHLEGHGAVHLGETRLVQYPSGFPSSFGTVPKPPEVAPAIAWIPTVTVESWFDFKSFMLGVVLTLGVGAFTASISFLRRVVKSRRHEREMRRIASLDG
jgi:hypothetical protein